MSVEIAKEFARCIDSTLYNEAARLLAEDCTYHYSEGEYQGRDAIINIYKQNNIQSNKIFDGVTYSSEVERMGEDVFKIHFIDDIQKGPGQHRFRSFQIVKIKDSLISEIGHFEIPGEMEALQLFYRRMTNGTVS